MRSDSIIPDIKEEVIPLLRNTSLSCEKISKMFNCSRGPIWKIQKIFNIQRPFNPKTIHFPKPCKWCGKFGAKPGFSKTRPNRGKFCSKECYTSWQKSKVNRGNKHPRWITGGKHESVSQRSRRSKSWKKWRTKVYKRDNYTCVLCGKTNCILDPHHILPKALFPKLRYLVSNGASLCRKCHRKTFMKELKYVTKIIKILFGGLNKWKLTKHCKKRLMQRRKVSGSRKQQKV